MHSVWTVLAFYMAVSFVQGVVMSLAFQLPHCAENAAFPHAGTRHRPNGDALGSASSADDRQLRSRQPITFLVCGRIEFPNRTPFVSPNLSHSLRGDRTRWWNKHVRSSTLTIKRTKRFDPPLRRTSAGCGRWVCLALCKERQFQRTKPAFRDGTGLIRITKDNKDDISIAKQQSSLLSSGSGVCCMREKCPNEQFAHGSVASI